jgi:hypothetical protein
MKKGIALFLIFAFFLEFTVFAGLGSNDVAYVGGSVATFSGQKDAVEGKATFNEGDFLRFYFGKGKQHIDIPYASMLDIEYGQKAGRRVGAAVATAVLLTPIGLVALFSKKRKHFVTIGFTDDQGKAQVAVFEFGKDVIRTGLSVLKAKTGKEIIYQDEEAKKNKG